jgi:GalNAc-alpha-(1->4)-GalNAc-alpha-(1->3)-diNAcBac-PP-undecaprenol alpha-1,4-N-acetyl-D-galactosaminyltransferase
VRIALVISSLGSGGAERVMSDMANHWASKGWGISLITFSGKDSSDFYPLSSLVQRIHLNLRRPTLSLSDKLLFNSKRIKALRDVLRAETPDVVISFMDSTNVLTILASSGMPHQVIVSERVDPVANPNISRFWRLARRLSYRFSDYVVAQTSEVAAWISENCKARVAVIPNALRPLQVTAVPREPLLLAVGRLDRQKGFDLLLKAFASLADRFPNWKLVLLGDGPERDELESLCATLGLNERVSMPGRVKDVECWLARASIMVQPSRFEGFPNVVLEGMGTGLPVITADCRSGPSDIIEDGKNGVLVPVEEVPPLAQAMSSLMDSPQTRIVMGRAALDVCEVYSQQRIMGLWEALLEKVLLDRT